MEVAEEGVAIGPMAVNLFPSRGIRRGHFTVGNKLPASKFLDPSWCRGRRGNATLFYKMLHADSSLQGITMRANGS